jgi:hypothetical protein
MNPPEIKKFSEVVFNVYEQYELSALLQSLNKRLDELVPTNVPPSEQVRLLLNVADRQGWLVRLVMAVIKDRGDTELVKNFLRQHPDWDVTKNPPLDHPCDTLKLFGGRSFIGRDKLREYLKDMETTTGKKLLVVRAEKRKMGKTYSKDLVEFLAYNRQPSRVVYHDLDADDYDPVKLAKKLGELMGVDLTLTSDSTSEQASRSNQELVTRLIPESPNPQPQVWWIILDGFMQKVPSEATRDFIDQLAQRIQARQDFRLLLLNYTYPQPLAVSAFAFKENVEPLGEADLKKHLTLVHTHRYGAEPSPEDLTDYLSDVNNLREKYRRDHPEYAEDQLLLNMAVTAVADSI